VRHLLGSGAEHLDGIYVGSYAGRRGLLDQRVIGDIGITNTRGWIIRCDGGILRVAPPRR
jgi:hypothetical protein